MPIILRLDRIMADRKITLKELAENVGISYVNLSKIKTGKVQGVRFSTLEAICETLDCQPGDILEYVRDDGQEGAVGGGEDDEGLEHGSVRRPAIHAAHRHLEQRALRTGSGSLGSDRSRSPIPYP